MTKASRPPRRGEVKFDIPGWFWGGDPTGLIAEAGLRSRLDRRTGQRWVETLESYRHEQPALVTVTDLAGPQITPNFMQLASRIDVAAPGPDEVITREILRRRANLQQAPEVTQALALMQLELLSAPLEALPEVAKSYFDNLLEVPLEGDSDARVFAAASSHLVNRGTPILYRVKLAAIMVQIAQDPRMQRGKLDHLLDRLTGDAGLAFQASSGLSDGLYVFDAYLGPMLGALSPSIWALAAPRSFGPIVTSLGQPLAGASGDAVELLQLINVPGPTEAVEVPRLTPGASGDAVRWWVDRLNEFFAVITDPAVFADADDTFVPSALFNAVLSTEQLFRRITSLQIAHRDKNARQVLMFTVLDTLERLTNRTIAAHGSLKTAQKTLQGLRAAIPTGAAEVLLPMAERAVSALEQVQAGFYFPREQTGNDRVVLQLPDRGPVEWSTDRATWTYLKALRDATHGHGSDKQHIRARTNALLAQHNGDLSHDLGLLGYLYLLDVMCNPDRLRERLISQTRLETA